jgi:hypothetical protein
VIDPGRRALKIRSGRYSSLDRSLDAADGKVARFRYHRAMVRPQWVASLVMPDLGSKPDLAIALIRE